MVNATSPTWNVKTVTVTSTVTMPVTHFTCTTAIGKVNTTSMTKMNTTSMSKMATTSVTIRMSTTSSVKANATTTAKTAIANTTMKMPNATTAAPAMVTKSGTSQSFGVKHLIPFALGMLALTQLL